MGVGGSAEEFMLMRALGRERLPALFYGLPSKTPTIFFFARRETIESFCLCFPHTTAAK